MAKKKDLTSQREALAMVEDHISAARDALHQRRDIAKACSHLRLAAELLHDPLFGKQIMEEVKAEEKKKDEPWKV